MILSIIFRIIKDHKFPLNTTNLLTIQSLQSIFNCCNKTIVLRGAAPSPVRDGHRAFALSTYDERGEYFGYGRPDR